LSLADRQRKHEQHHERTLEQQILDALLRIEELLQKPEKPVSLPERRPDLDTKPDGTKATKPTGARKVDRL
jgi:hypothetical protein